MEYMCTTSYHVVDFPSSYSSLSLSLLFDSSPVFSISPLPPPSPALSPPLSSPHQLAQSGT